MIKKLQNRFILISMLSMLLVLTVIMGAINILNYQKDEEFFYVSNFRKKN